ncbi:type II toxin-antitoxin system VapC family toxin [Rhodoblastus sp.]|jgi:predicted nucleic acid-binding protein|uniref:type II toxin-antitoxin system VapC family toxin n=1 Tax=Rhodoblastus sp. TaxID=1962975 RepID=UPI0025FBE08F|nr:type II toxin-antitoxin system VapC family toxin [Rhodoblastus sp.]
MAFVVDVSLAAAWILPDESSPAADLLLASLNGGPALAPSLFWHEARSIVTMAEKRGRIGKGEALAYLAGLRALPLDTRGDGPDGVILSLALTHGLTSYDAAYLALAITERLPLATLDKKLAAASHAEQVALLGPLATP